MAWSWPLTFPHDPAWARGRLVPGGGGMESAGSLPRVKLTMTWDGPRRLVVDHSDGLVTVVAHAELSEANVVAACVDLDASIGEAVLNAWRDSLMPPRGAVPPPSAN